MPRAKSQWALPTNRTDIRTKTFGWRPQNSEPKVASARIRCLNTIRELQSERFPIELYRKNHESRYDAVIFSKAYKPKDIAIAERLKARGAKIVFDLCDNHFLLGPERLQLLKTMYALADHWVVSSHKLADVVREQVGSDRPLTVIEDAVEEKLRGNPFDIAQWCRARYDLLQLGRFLDAQKRRGATPLVWFGNNKASYDNSGLRHIARIRPLLEALNRIYPLSLTVISDSREAYEAVFSDWRQPTFYLDWNAHNFFRAMRRHRIAIIPIDTNEFTAVKTNNRIALSLYLGLGVVADGIDSYRVFEDCSYLDNWEGGLRQYLEEPAFIDEHVHRGQALIARYFSPPMIAAQWRRLLEQL